MRQALILAGGNGTRLWPISRQKTPKQFQNFVGDRSLLQQTFDRIKTVIPPEQIWVITTANQVKFVSEQLPEIKPNHIIGEPVGRNTAAAIGLGTLRILREDSEAIIAVMPSDHFVGKPEVFAQVAGTILDFVVKNPLYLATIGIKPTNPNTGYGYIKMGDELDHVGKHILFQVDSFIEKPNQETAQTFFESWEYLWNGGYFFFVGTQLMSYFDQFIPVTKKLLEEYLASPENSELYQSIHAEPIDKAIAERLSSLAVIPADLDWSDLGNWGSIYEIMQSNIPVPVISRGNHVDVSSNNCLVMAKDKLIATVGLTDVVIVDAGDALLVCNRNEVQNIKTLVDRLKSTNNEHYL